MVNGPPCAACGWTLRWVPEQNLWGCDRCRQTYPVSGQPAQQQPAPQQPPPQQYQQPQQPQQPQYQQAPQPYQQPQQPQYQQPPPQQGHSPYAPGTAPQAPYVPQAPVAQAVAPVTQGKPKSKKGLIIVLAALVVGGGVLAAVLVMKGGGGVSGGSGSKEALVDNVLAAMSANDADALEKSYAGDDVKLAAVECEGEKAEKQKDPERIARHKKEQREAMEKVVKDIKLKKLVVDSVDEEKKGGRHDDIKKGEKAGSHCTAKYDISERELTIKAHGELDGKETKVTGKFRAVSIDGTWFLSDAPQLTAAGGGDCKGATAHMMDLSKKSFSSMGIDVTKMSDAVVAICEKDKWSDEILKCLTEAKSESAIGSCKLTPEQTKSMTEAMTKIIADAKPVTPPPPPPPPVTDNAGSGSGSAEAGSDVAAGSDKPADTGGTAVVTDGVPPACVDYQKAMEKVMACPKMPAASKDGMKQALDATKGAWGNMKGMPASAVKSMNDACQQGLDAMKQLMSAMGC